MSWGHVDDKLHSHPKVDKAGVEAMGLWVLAFSWSQDNHTGGVITKSRAISICKSQKKATAYIAKLLEAGFWEPHPTEPDTYIMHDFEDWNPAAAKQATHRSSLSDKRSQAGKAGAAKRWQEHQVAIGKPMANDGKLAGNSEANGSQPDPARAPPCAPALGFGSSLLPEDPDLGSPEDLSKTSTNGALPSVGAERPSGLLQRQAAGQDDDGCFGEAVRGWGRGVSSVTQRPFSVPRFGVELDKLIAALATHHPAVDGRDAWAAEKGAEFARAGLALNVHKFVEWLNGGTGSAGAASPGKPAPAAGEPRSPHRRPIEPLRRRPNE